MAITRSGAAVLGLCAIAINTKARSFWRRDDLALSILLFLSSLRVYLLLALHSRAALNFVLSATVLTRIIGALFVGRLLCCEFYICDCECDCKQNVCGPDNMHGKRNGLYTDNAKREGEKCASYESVSVSVCICIWSGGGVLTAQYNLLLSSSATRTAGE